ncbi:MAG TPA: histidine phosphatase family protein [Solirubrobacteraceae bacterium]|nr:histidine phosphatase family protein [Solirubrobacteraceae bacterium]
MANRPRTLVVIRHGETEWSRAGRHTGLTDIPLTEAGRAAAAALAPRLAEQTFALVLCSPLQRARETCALAGFGQQAELCEDLVEWNYGDYDGLTSAEIRETRPGWDLWHDGCPGGEQPDEVGARLDRVLARVAEVDGDVLAVAHGHSLRVLAARWIELEPAGGARLRLAAAGLGRLGFEHGTRVIDQWNV